MLMSGLNQHEGYIIILVHDIFVQEVVWKLLNCLWNIVGELEGNTVSPIVVKEALIECNLPLDLLKEYVFPILVAIEFVLTFIMDTEACSSSLVNDVVLIGEEIPSRDFSGGFWVWLSLCQWFWVSYLYRCREHIQDEESLPILDICHTLGFS